MPFKYSYDVPQDFPSGLINPANLDREIRAESGILTHLNRVDTRGRTANVIFSVELPPGEKTVLDNNTTNPAGGLIAQHDSTRKRGKNLKTERDAETSEDQNVWTRKVRYRTAGKKRKAYNIQWYAEVRSQGAANIQLRIQLDGSNIALVRMNSNNFIAFSGSDVRAIKGKKDIEMDFRTTSVGNAVEIRNARIIAIPVG